jgi:hypothetical protein
MIAVLGRMTNLQEVEAVLCALKAAHKRGTIGNVEAKLPRNCYGTSDIDVLISGIYQVPVLTYQHCNNGGGVALTFWCGLEHFEKCKFCSNGNCRFLHLVLSIML